MNDRDPGGSTALKLAPARPAASPGAIAGGRLPGTLEVEGERLALTEVLKLGRFIALGRYTGPSRDLVFKSYATRSPLQLPARWFLRFLARHELRTLRRLEGVRGVPRLVAALGRDGMAYEFVAGHPIGRNERVPEGFFPELDETLREVHARGVAHADLCKRTNLLVGDDGSPHVIDFQIAWSWPRDPDAPWAARCVPGFVGRALLALLQRADRHHLDKRWSRMQPGTLDPERLAAVGRATASIRMVRALTWPYHAFRRWQRRR